MRIFTLDLSTHSTGYCAGQNGEIRNHGCIVANQKNTIQRIITMREQIKILLDIYKPDKIIMQEVRPEFNSRTNKVLMWLQAAVVIASYQVNPKIQCQFKGASEWRAAIKIKQGRGVKRDQLKPQDVQYVKNKYNIIVNDDEADAICLFDAYWVKQTNEINWQ